MTKNEKKIKDKIAPMAKIKKDVPIKPSKAKKLVKGSKGECTLSSVKAPLVKKTQGKSTPIYALNPATCETSIVNYNIDEDFNNDEDFAENVNQAESDLDNPEQLNLYTDFNDDEQNILDDSLDEDELQDDDAPIDPELIVQDEEVQALSQEFEKLEPLLCDEINRNNEEVLLFISENRDRLTPEQLEDMYTDFVRKNQKIVYYVANKQPHYVLDLQEAIGVGFLGFAKALNKFDPTRKVKFTTFAIHCIKNEICFNSKKEKRHFDHNESLSKPQFTDKNGRSLTLEDTVADTAYTPEETLREKERNLQIRERLKKLCPFERYVIVARFGLDRNKTYTQKDIAAITHQSQANISKIEKGCKEKLETIFRDLIE